jgi:hypothetical protein
MIFAAIFPSFFQGDDIAGVGDDADGTVISVGVATNLADGIGGEMKAHLT